MSLLYLRTTAAGFALVLGVCAALLPGKNASAAPAESAAAVSAARAVTTSAVQASSAVPPVGPFAEPEFAGTCTWHEFGEGEQPPLWLMFMNPLCVEYNKRDITFDDGGALRFLVAEPSRFAITMLTCRYYQRDHWSVQATNGAVPYVAWDGQYWWDKTNQRAGARLSHFSVNGRTVGIGDAIAVLRSANFDELADVLSGYGQEAGETGLTVALPFDLGCALIG
ncbi:hypothetical protein OG585_53700 (plasmid) [Streptomyces sp. NBC_01340]|uniref:hypothetical protein n=1 Tax=unclassified Streptomyces TaxID=2593676 RepID=UPI002255E750|nr:MULTISPECIES: hypothetical protein [unclassified Streptomyces]MCX4461726.1 hypothetical protein [Streptomyces sp. NBC_01719]MCX4490635.1 hypothetical protein [Streptomyces sp. NBC_01728]MCX4597370.1 hypothetical protein [Streptomyces sp. NBC_01549]WSI45605.1 hypothetical protein OG585_53700 [Streptomyces sp. NBC_01340]